MSTAANTADIDAAIEDVIEEFDLLATLQDRLADALGTAAIASVVTACIALIATAIVSHFVTKLLRRVLSHEDSPLPETSLFIKIGRVTVWLFGISIMLSTCFSVDVSGALAAMGVGGIAISLGFQDTIKNLIGGLQMSISGSIQPGDHVEIAGRRGVVQDVSWRHVIIEMPTGQSVIIPNSAYNDDAIVKLAPVEKIVVPVSLYKNFEDLEGSIELMKQTISEEVAKICPITKEPIFIFSEVQEFSYLANVVVWVDLTDIDYSKTEFVRDAIVRSVAKHSPMA